MDPPLRAPHGVVAGRFELKRLLGTGGMGSVWLAHHQQLGISVAVKFLDQSLAGHAEYVARFTREAQLAAQINSRHVVRVLDHGMDERGRPYIAMEFLEGIDLAHHLEQSGRMSFAEVARLVMQTCRGLRRAHTAGIVHRDIKPENLYLCPDDEDEAEPFIVKILDFGVAKDLAQRLDVTQSGNLLGTPLYMSPEQAKGLDEIDFRADIYSLGAVAYTCLTGGAPFSHLPQGELLAALCTTDPPRISSRRHDLPPGTDAWFEVALHREPGQRFASARMAAQTFLALDPMVQVGAHSEPAGRVPALVQAERVRIFGSPSEKHRTSEAITEVFADAELAAVLRRDTPVDPPMAFESQDIELEEAPLVGRFPAPRPHADAPIDDEEEPQLRLSRDEVASLRRAITGAKVPPAAHATKPARRWIGAVVAGIVIVLGAAAFLATR